MDTVSELKRNLAGVTVALVAIIGLAQPAAGLAFQQDVTLTRPNAAGPPTQVRVGIYVVDIEQIDNSRQQFAVDFVLAAPLDLRDFPFDSQALPITILSVLYGPDDVQFVFAPELSGRVEQFSIAEWTVGTGVAEEGVYAVTSDHEDSVEYLALIDYVFEAQRSLSYYAWKVVGPLVIIVLMSWAVFWVDPKHVGPNSLCRPRQS